MRYEPPPPPPKPTYRRFKVEGGNTARALRIVPPYSQTIKWEALLEELDTHRIIDKPFLKHLAVKYEIYADTDYAILIRLLLASFDNLHQGELVDLLAEIIEDLEK